MAENIMNSSEMRVKSLDWNLACDVQLRKRLELTAQRFQQKALSLSESIKDLNAKSTVTAAKLGNVTNSLLLLSNIQFIESRVYEDEDTTDTRLDTIQDSEKENLSQPQKEHKFKTDIGNALSAGAVFIQNAFEKVELEQSDSEDDEEVVSALEPIYESRNVYHSRKLPHVIGTQSFLSDEYIGLEHSPEDNEKDELSESSESESEDEIEDLEDLKSNLEPSGEVTESDFAAAALNPGNEIKLITDHQDSEFSSENEDDFPTKSTAKTTSKKTGNSSKPEVAKSSISASGIFDDQDQKHDTAEDNDFEEHVEKNEEFQSEIETKKENNFLSELASKIGGGGGSVKTKKKDQGKIFEEDNKSIKSNISSKSVKSNVSKSLFDSDSDDDLFTSRPSKPIKKKAQASTKLPPATTTNVKISEAASGSGQNRKSPEKPSKKNTLFDDISDDDEADIPFSKSRPKLNPVLETKKKEPTKKPTKVSALFEDSSEDEMDSLFAKKSVIKPPVKPSLFEDQEEPEVTKPQTSQTTNILTESLKNAQKKKKSIFDDSDGSESDSENDVNQDTTNDSTTKVDHTETSDGAKANVEIAEDKESNVPKTTLLKQGNALLINELKFKLKPEDKAKEDLKEKKDEVFETGNNSNPEVTKSSTSVSGVLETKTKDKVENDSDETDGGKMSKSTFTIEAKKSKSPSKIMSTGSYNKNFSENQPDILKPEKQTTFKETELISDEKTNSQTVLKNQEITSKLHKEKITPEIIANTLQTEKITSQSEKVATQQTEIISPQTEIISPQTEKLFPQTEKASMQTVKVTPQLEETGIMSLQTGNLSPQTGILTPQTGILIPQTGISTLQTGITSPETVIMPPQTENSQLLSSVTKNRVQRGNAKRRPPTRQKMKAQAAESETSLNLFENHAQNSSSNDLAEVSRDSSINGSPDSATISPKKMEPKPNLLKQGNNLLINELKFKLKPAKSNQKEENIPTATQLNSSINLEKDDLKNNSKPEMAESSISASAKSKEVDVNPVIDKTDANTVDTIDKIIDKSNSKDLDSVNGSSSKEDAKKVTKSAKTTTTLFDVEDSDSDNDLFGPSPSMQKPENNSSKPEMAKSSTTSASAKKSNLFDNNDLLSSQSPMLKTIKSNKSVTKVEALFGGLSSSDEDDLFTAKTTTTMKTGNSSSKPEVVAKSSATSGGATIASPKSNLFGDDSDSDDDIFSLASKANDK